MDDTNAIIERICQVRKDTGLTREEFARRIGHTYSKQHSIEYHKKLPKDAYIDHMCDVYGVNPEWVMTGQGEIYIDHRKQIMDRLDEIKSPELYRSVLNMINSIIDAEEKTK